MLHLLKNIMLRYGRIQSFSHLNEFRDAVKQYLCYIGGGRGRLGTFLWAPSEDWIESQAWVLGNTSRNPQEKWMLSRNWSSSCFSVSSEEGSIKEYTSTSKKSEMDWQRKQTWSYDTLDAMSFGWDWKHGVECTLYSCSSDHKTPPQHPHCNHDTFSIYHSPNTGKRIDHGNK